MKEGQRLWTREELILAINLYCKTPFGRIYHANPDIIALATLIDRTPSSVALKLSNFASLDPSLQKRGIKGKTNSSKLDRQVWAEFYESWDRLALESEVLLARKNNVELGNDLSDADFPSDTVGLTREARVQVRVKQSFFRTMVLSAYNSCCCITGISNPDLLVAGHIKRWADDKDNRMNPCNGIAINGLHDKAFESGLITITPDYRIHVSSILAKQKGNPWVDSFFLCYDNHPIHLPSRFCPDPDFLRYHNDVRFKP